MSLPGRESLREGVNLVEGDIQPREFVVLIVSYRPTTTTTMRMMMTVAVYQACAFISRLAPFALLQRNAHRGRFNDPISVCDLAWPWKTGRMLRDWQRGLALQREREREREKREREGEGGRGSEGQVTSNLWKVRGRHRLRGISKRASYIVLYRAEFRHSVFNFRNNVIIFPKRFRN